MTGSDAGLPTALVAFNVGLINWINEINEINSASPGRRRAVRR